jgi:hypothetical protein
MGLEGRCSSRHTIGNGGTIIARSSDAVGLRSDSLEPERLTRYYVKRLEHLGHSVKLEPCVSA